MLQLPLSSFPELQTINLRLRQLSAGDSHALFQIYSNSDVTRFYELETFHSVQDALALINIESARWDRGEAVRWGITQLQNEIVIGTCGLLFDSKNHTAALGYDLAQPYWRRGIMTEALTIVIRFTFLTLGINRLQAMVMPENTPSTRLLESLGFSKEGLLRQAAYFKGRYHNMICYALLKPDWSQA